MTDETVTSPARVGSRQRRRMNAILLAAAAISLALTVGGLLHQGAKGASPPRPAAAMTVTTAVPHEAAWPLTIEASGAIAAWQEASVGAQIGGYRLVLVRVNVGDEVRKGEVLAKLDPALLRADEAQLEAAAAEADANRARMQAIQHSGAVSDQDVLQFVTRAKAADAALAAKRLQLRYTLVRAPDDGAISARTATLGAVVSVGQELFRVIRQNRLEWRGEFTASQLAHARAGEQVALTLPDGSPAMARVRRIAPALEDKSRLDLVYADILPGSAAREGMYADGRLTWGRAAALVVPADCVIIRDGRSYVVKLADSTPHPRVELQAVTVGRRQEREVEIESGVSIADRLAEQGAGFLNDGDVVDVEPRAGQPSGRGLE